MTNVEVSADISAKLSLNPKLSQISIIISLFISAISYLSSFVFIWNAKNWIVPCLVGTLFLAVSCVGWWRSQRAIDMSNSTPTELTGINGVKIFTDTRAIESNNAVNNLSKIMQVIAHRSPLPEANGLIDNNGNVIPNSIDASNLVINKINEENSSSSETIEKLLFSNQSHILNLPVDNELEKHNGLAKTT